MIKFLRMILPLHVCKAVRIILNKLSVKCKNAEYSVYKNTSHIGFNSPNKWIRKSSQIDGWLFPGEHEFLWELACRSGKGHILEIGTWMGKSTCILAGTCIEKMPDTKVICLDPFDMSGSAQQEQYHKRLITEEPGTFYQFVDNAKRFGFIDQVVPIAVASEAVLPIVGLQFRLIFIDATHDYDSTKKDVELSLPRLLKGGLLVLHDAMNSPSWPGIEKYVSESLQHHQALNFLASCNTMVAFEKIKDVSA